MKKLHSTSMIKVNLLFALLVGFTMLSSFRFVSIDDSKEEWTLLKAENNLELYGQLTHCEGSAVYLFVLKNLAVENRNVDVEITVPNEAAYGTITFQENLQGTSETSSDCRVTDLHLPKMTSDGDLGKLKINLNIK